MYIVEELIVKKSRFIAYCFDFDAKENLKQILANLKKEHKKSRHICYAYLIYQNGTESAGFSDDGEPKNTAGRPIYDLLKLKNIHNKLIVVVRYFGGIKLGAGGLVRAYRSGSNIFKGEKMGKHFAL
ncbi:proline dipeptidase pepQ [Mycoplasmopsis gallopavonis]|uniref:Proline dipeptidase pepQ n=1 Tax=Mycoplasmopsis gallopavonis TaxID=76629 RepID=A0A449AYI7_9BACT|nr:YigZ family protein [Mycoplasmopsis gallopavonis]VEU72547.1 proline dipeptidase pepQ [Mycoplasmopsis gallopavonis]